MCINDPGTKSRSVLAKSTNDSKIGGIINTRRTEILKEEMAD